MAKRSAEESLDRDRSPRGRSGGPSERGQSMPAGPSTTSKRSQPVTSPNFKLEGQIEELTKGLQMMGTQLQTLASVVEKQQSAFVRTQETFQVQQTMIQNLQAQRTALPISPRVQNPRSSPFGAATNTGGQANGLSPFGTMGPTTTNQAESQQNVTASGEVSSGVPAGIPKIALPGGIEIPLGASSSTTAAGTGGTSEKPVLDAFQRPDKWLPEMPVVDAKNWRTRTEEIIGFETFMENFSAWLGLVSASFATEVRFAMTASSPIDSSMLTEEQKARGIRLLNMLRQIFRETPKARVILLAYSASSHLGERNGYEALRLIAHEYLVRSRQEVMHFRNSLMGRTFKSNSVTELIKQMEVEESRYEKLLNMLPASLSRSGLELQSTDLAMLFLRSLPMQIREYTTMHSNTDDYKDLKIAALKYETSQRLWTEIGGNTAPQYMQSIFDPNKPKGKGEKGKGKGKEKGKRSNSSSPNKKADDKSDKEKNAICFRCNRKGHFQSNCRARTDKDGNPLSPMERPKNQGEHASKGNSNTDGKGKGKDGKGKGKKGKGKVHEFISSEQPELEESPASRAARADPTAPMSPFVASHASLSAPCLQTMAEFERTLNFEDCKRNENPRMSVDDFVVDSCLSFDSVLSSCGDLFQETCFELNPVVHNWFMPFLMPPSNWSHQDHSDVCWWLIDSGASASVVSSRFLSEYEVLHQVLLPTNRAEGFSSASGEVIVPTAVACLRAFFRMNSMEDPRVEELKECLITVFVADVNVVSVGTLLKKGWCLGSNGAFMEITKDGFRLQITTWHNVPWMYHEKCGAVKCQSVDATPPDWSKTHSRELRSKGRASSSKHVRLITNTDV